MSHYGILHPSFWGGPTGREIASVGGKDAQVLALYLMANQDATMIGLYPVDLVIIRARVQTLTPKAIDNALAALAQVEFADYDRSSTFVWVREMAKYRLSLNIKPLDAKDHRVKHVQRLYRECRPNPFLGPFFNRYGAELHLTERRSFDAATPSKAVRRALEAPSKPVTVTGTVTGSEVVAGSETELQDQDPAASRRGLRIEFKALSDVETLVRKAVHDHLDANPDAPDGDLVETAKVIAGRCHAVGYKGHELTAIVDAVRATRARRSA